MLHKAHRCLIKHTNVGDSSCGKARRAPQITPAVVKGMHATCSGKWRITSEDRSGIVRSVGAIQLMEMPRQAHHERQLDLFLEEPAFHDDRL